MPLVDMRRLNQFGACQQENGKVAGQVVNLAQIPSKPKEKD